MLDFHTPPLHNFTPDFCAEESVTINGTIYDSSNPTGIEVLLNASSNNCDSTVFVDINFYEPIEYNINMTFCEGEEIEVNNTIYNQGNPTGVEVINGVGQMGCDSTIFVDLEYFEPVVGFFVTSICEDEQIDINGTIYDKDNTSGTEILTGMASNSCDSTVFINLSIYDPAEHDLSPTLCDGESIVINGTVYDQSSPTGIETLVNGSVNGCDSTITIQLSFYEEALNDLTTTLCDRESLQINDVTYNAANPSGVEILQNASSEGCDSTVQIDLSFYPPVIENLTESICDGSSFQIGNNTFSNSGNYSVTLENASTNGCDSLVNLSLSVITDEMFGLAEAGEDFALCDGTQTSLEANQPTGTTGQWTTNSGTIIDSPDNFITNLNNLAPGNNSFVWTLSSDLCPDYHADEVIIYVEEVPEANDDNYVLIFNSISNELDLIDNDQFSNDGWFFELISFPDRGNLDDLGQGVFEYSPEPGFSGNVVFEYQLCSENCPDLCTEAKVRIQVDPPDFSNVELPNGITPNGDGINDAFIIPQLEFRPEQYPDRELIIFNRWGDVVFNAKPYNNDWHGVNQNGQPLPLSTYYYVLRLDIGEGNVFKGDITILK